MGYALGLGERIDLAVDALADVAPDALFDGKKRLGHFRIELDPGEATDFVARGLDRKRVTQSGTGDTAEDRSIDHRSL